MQGLNSKHKAFADHYLKDPNRNARRAYKKVYPKVKDSAADTNASRLLKNAKVQEYVKSIENKATENVLITNEEIFAGYKTILNVGLKQYEVKLKNGKIINVLVDPKNSKGALDSLAKIKGMFVEKIEVDVKKLILDV